MKTMKYILLAFVLLLSLQSFAQTINTGFFNERYQYRHELNPAFGNETDYVAVPFMNANVGMRGNVGIKDFLYVADDETVLFLNPAVSPELFAKRMKDNVKMTGEAKMQLLGAGFHAFEGYNTVGVNIRVNAGAVAPGEVLKAMKNGLTNREYDFSNLGVRAQAFGELALGHSHQIDENLRIGGKVKLLFGIENVDLKMNKAKLVLDDDNYTASVDAEFEMGVRRMEFSHSVNESSGHEYVNGKFENLKTGISGFGFAFDLGAEYKLNDWDFSLAFQDLGVISYNNTFKASTDGCRTFDMSKYIFSVDGDAENSFEKESDRMIDDIARLYELDDKGNVGGSAKGLGVQVNAGVNYTLPSYDKLSFGLTNTSRLQGKYSWTDFRLGLNIRPVNFLALSASMSAGTFGVGFGWMVDLQMKKGVNLFFGMDAMPSSITNQGVPLSSNSQFAVGINIPLNIKK